MISVRGRESDTGMATEAQRHREIQKSIFNNCFSRFLCVSVPLWPFPFPKVWRSDLDQFAGQNPGPLRSLTALFLATLLTFPIPAALAQRRQPLRPVARDYYAGKFVLIPHDDRPQSLQQPRMLARVADHDLIVPPARATASAEALIEWAKGVDYGESDGVIVSLDAIAGSAQEAGRLRGVDFVRLIEWMRARRPGMPIFGFTSDSSDQIIQTALNLIAESALDFLLISGSAAPGRAAA